MQVTGFSQPAPRLRKPLPHNGEPRSFHRGPLWWLFVLLVAAAWVYIAGRSATLGFTADESISYGFLHGQNTLVRSANNQWLNTLLMGGAQALLGQAEWALRFPNVLSFLVYGGSCLWLVHALRTTAARLVCFALLMGDPFLLEFFGLARGYGLSTAFATAALAVLLLYPTRGSGGRSVIRFALTGALGIAAFYGNFSTLNLVVALLAGAGLDSLIRIRGSRIVMSRGTWWAALAVAGVILAGMAPGLVQVQYLRATHQLYYGGPTGFVQDTIGTLVQTWGYVYRYPPALTSWARVLAWTVAGLMVLAFAFAAFQLVARRRWKRTQLSACVLLTAVLAVLVERLLFGTLYPIDRVALAYIPAFAALAGLVVDDIGAQLGLRGRQALAVGGAAVLVLGLVNFGRTANTTSALTWSFDASSRATIDRLMAFERATGPPRSAWTLVVPFPRQFALSYYTTRYHLWWLDVVVDANSVSGNPQAGQRIRPSGDFYELVPGRHDEAPGNTRLLATLPQDGTQLRVADFLH